MNQSINRRLTALNVSNAPIVEEYDDSIEGKCDNIFINAEVHDFDGHHIGHISELRMEDIYTPGIEGLGGSSSSSGSRVGTRWEFKIVIETTKSISDLRGMCVSTCSCNIGEIENFESSYHPISGNKIRVGIVLKYMCEPCYTYSNESLRRLYMHEPLESSSIIRSSGPSISSSSESPNASQSYLSSSSSSSSSSSERGDGSLMARARGSPGQQPGGDLDISSNGIDRLFANVLNSAMNDPVINARLLDAVHPTTPVPGREEVKSSFLKSLFNKFVSR